MIQPEFTKRILSEEDWNSWSQAQQEFILQENGKQIQNDSLQAIKLNAYYSGKTRAFGPASKEVGPKCHFAYCFYAFPRNWSIGSDSDVWNLMRCANVNCGHYFDSCL
jgi:hypothetical protein